MRHVVGLADRPGCMAEIEFAVALVLATLLKGVCAAIDTQNVSDDDEESG